MSPLRRILRPPPFKPYYQSCTATRHGQGGPSLLLQLPLQSRVRWSYLWYTGLLALGIVTGLGARQFAAPLGLPSPGSPEDKVMVESLGRDADRLDVVQSLRKQSFFHLHADAALAEKGDGVDKFKGKKGWLEIDLGLLAEGGQAQGANGMMSALRGTRGLGVQRAFWNAETKEMVAVVWIGGGLAGWPGVCHGGAIATIFEEVMARMVRGDENGAAVEVDRQVDRPSSISITYAKPTYTLGFYVLRASLSQPQPRLPDLTKQIGSKQSAEIIGTLESIKGHVCVKVKATFDIAL
ncbi:hypothetical protein ACEQ8H_007260 [Pleosporales sp. CAS-2024a]